MFTPRFLIIIAFVLLISCKKADTIGPFKGKEVQLYTGKAWTTVELNDDMLPRSVSLMIDKNALLGLLLSDIESSTVIELHPKGSNSAINHVVIDWRPRGHEDPAHIFDKAQFNFYFYMMGRAEREHATDPARIANLPGADYLPPNYIAAAQGLPRVGLHWHNETAPEYNGQPLDQSLQFGSYDGKLNFYEWIIPITKLTPGFSFDRPIPQPAKFKTAGYFPTSIQINMTDNTITLTLSQFVYSAAS